MNRPRGRTLCVAVLATAAGLVAVPAAYAGTTQDAGLAPYHNQHVSWKSCQRGPWRQFE